jgi:hypothetical protein
MAAELIGGREYYTDALQLTAGETCCIGKGMVKGIFCTTTSQTTFVFQNGSVTFAPDANSIVPFAPVGVTGAGTYYALY